MKVLNGLVIVLEADKRFLCLAVPLCTDYVSNFADLRMEVLRYRSFFLSRCIQQQ